MELEQKTVAIVGASNDPDKYGNKVLKDLKSKGIDVIPINPHEDKIEGIKAFHSLSELDKKPDLVVFVVPPKITLKVLEQVKKLGIKDVWMQPGSQSQQAIDFCKNNAVNCTANACIMVRTDE